MSLTKAEITDMLLKQNILPENQAKYFVDAFYEEMISALENGFDIRFSGFGNFNLKDKNSRPGRNPKTGEKVTIKSRRVVTFKAGEKMKNHINSGVKE